MGKKKREKQLLKEICTLKKKKAVLGRRILVVDIRRYDWKILYVLDGR